MVERLVDVLKDNVTLHSYPITVGSSHQPSPDNEYEDKAREAAAYDGLVTDAELNSLTTRMHVSRSGPLAQYGDNRGTLSQTREGLVENVRERAYFLWQQDGCPEGLGDQYWHRAHDQHIRERAYSLWQREGCLEGRSEEYWLRTCQFERF